MCHGRSKAVKTEDVAHSLSAGVPSAGLETHLPTLKLLFHAASCTSMFTPLVAMLNYGTLLIRSIEVLHG